MQQLYDTASICRTLRDGIAKGYWTLEQLDKPSAGRILIEQEMKRHKVIELRSFQFPPHRNLLRDYHPQTVDKGPDPRDFEAPADSRSGIQGEGAHLPLEGGEDSDQHYEHPLF